MLARMLMLTLLLCGAAQANTFAPPVQLHKCSPSKPLVQQWTLGANGSLYTLDAVKHTGYCLTAGSAGQSVNLKPGTTVIAADCAGLTTSNNGGTQANQTAGEFWTVHGATLSPKNPKPQGLCLSVASQPPPGRPGRPGGIKGTNAGGGSTGTLGNCSSSAAQFAFNLPGTIVHKPSGLCLTVGRCAAPPPPPAPRGDQTPAGKTPCDIYASVGSPCVAAVRHCLCPAVPLPFAAGTLPLPSVLHCLRG